MSISNRRTGKIGPPPGSYDTEWLNRLRILLEKLAGDTLPAGEIVTLVLSVLGYPAGGFARQVLTSNGLSSLFVAGDSFGYCEETSVDVIDEG